MRSGCQHHWVLVRTLAGLQKAISMRCPCMRMRWRENRRAGRRERERGREGERGGERNRGRIGEREREKWREGRRERGEGERGRERARALFFSNKGTNPNLTTTHPDLI